MHDTVVLDGELEIFRTEVHLWVELEHVELGCNDSGFHVLELHFPSGT